MRKIILFNILLLASFLLPEQATSSQSTSSQLAEWVEVLDILIRIDSARAAGQYKTAAAELEGARDRWPKPFSELASEYLNYLKENKESHLSTSPGVELFAEEIKNLENDALKKELQERILRIQPVCQNACAFILMDRASADFKSGNLQAALDMYQRILRDYPDSRLHGACIFNVGIVLCNLDRFEEAITAFKQLIKMNVNNREFVAPSIMEMGYRNYHYRSARNISWCYEKLGKYKDAYHWNNLARTTYPYEACCATCADMQRRSLDRSSGRIAFSGGIWLAVRHIADLLGNAWYGWMPLLIWIVLAIVILRKLPQKRALMIHITCLVVFAIAVLFWIVNRWYLPHFPPTRHEINLLWGYAWIFSIIGIVIALTLRKLKPGIARLIATAAVLIMAFVNIRFLILLIVPIKFAYLSLHDIQLIVFTYFLFPAAAVVSAGTAVVKLLVGLKRG
jgi:tetratricopeptide (TPR) repeat protein